MPFHVSSTSGCFMLSFQLMNPLNTLSKREENKHLGELVTFFSSLLSLWQHVSETCSSLWEMKGPVLIINYEWLNYTWKGKSRKLVLPGAVVYYFNCKDWQINLQIQPSFLKSLVATSGADDKQICGQSYNTNGGGYIVLANMATVPQGLEVERKEQNDLSLPAAICSTIYGGPSPPEEGSMCLQALLELSPQSVHLFSTGGLCILWGPIWPNTGFNQFPVLTQDLCPMGSSLPETLKCC